MIAQLLGLDQRSNPGPPKACCQCRAWTVPSGWRGPSADVASRPDRQAASQIFSRNRTRLPRTVGSEVRVTTARSTSGVTVSAFSYSPSPSFWTRSALATCSAICGATTRGNA